METSETYTPPEPMRWREVKAGTQGLLKCVGCKTHFWAPENEVGTRCFCTPDCEKRKKERDKRLAEREEHKKKTEDSETTTRGWPLRSELTPEQLQERREHENKQRRKQSRRKRQEDLGKEVARMTKKSQLTPAESAKLRKTIHDYVEMQLQDANDVVLGAKDWSPTQARVFSTLLNKVCPT